MGIDILGDWGITADELAEIVAENPSMRGLMFGFVAEYKLKKEWLIRPGITNVVRPRSHDRRQKCDFTFDYRGVNVRLEVKCLDTPKVKLNQGVYSGTFQCNASDTTEVRLPNGRNEQGFASYDVAWIQPSPTKVPAQECNEHLMAASAALRF